MTQKPLDENYNDGWQTENSAADDPYKYYISYSESSTTANGTR